VIFLVSGGVARLTLFTLTDRAVLTILFLLWGNNQISLAFFFSTLFNKSRFALVIVFLIVLCSVIISLVIDQLFLGSQAPAGYFVWPPFAFYRALGLINRASYTEGVRPYDLGMLRNGDEVFTIVLFLLFEIPVFLFLAFYLEAVFPTEFGVRKSWHFPVTDLIRAYQRYQSRKLHGESKSEAELAIGIQIDESETKFEDADVKAERARVTDASFAHDKYPLVMKNMRKVYAGRGGQGPKLAVKDVSFAVEKGITFGLLGPNGIIN
jgi:ABC-type multidrug transport system fused ATPase/permease subunit